MLLRKSPDLPYDHAPKTLISAFERELKNFLQADLKAANWTLSLYGFFNDEESCLALDLGTKSHKQGQRCALFVSRDRDIKSKNNEEKVWEDLVQTLAELAQTILLDFENPNFTTRWEKITVRESTLYYLLSRENIELTLKADQLLKKEGI